MFGLGVTAFLLCAQVIIQNVHITTTNGLWKSMDVVKWINNPSLTLIDPSNVLLYPIYSSGAKLLNAIGVFRRLPWRQMAIINAVFAGFTATMAFAFVSAWVRDTKTAFLAATAYTLSGYVLVHGLINEDVMPSFTVIFASTLLACIWFARPTAWRIVVVALIFATGWLIEWRMMFPSLPPFLMALFLAQGTIAQRFWRPALFLGAMAVPPAIVALLTLSFNTPKQAFDLFLTLFWTGKGVGTGWGGYSLNKLWLEWSGAAEAIFGGRHIQSPNWYADYSLNGIIAGTVLMLALAAVSLHYLWRNRADQTVRAAAIVVGGNAFCGVIFNLYSQPQDPQMQINVMIWALFGWALLIGYLISPARFGLLSPIPRVLGYALAIILLLTPSAYALKNAYQTRGQDAEAVKVMKAIETKFDFSRTVFLYHDFEALITWQSTRYGLRQYLDIKTLPPAPDMTFKWIGLVFDSIASPQWTGAQHATKISEDIDTALSKGYRVISPLFWSQTEETWVTSYSTVVSRPEKTRELYTILHRTFEGVEVWIDPRGAAWYEITRRKS